MRKIPTLFVRDENDRRYVTCEVTPGCEWVLAGEGRATRKYDGTCVMFDGQRWWARREVKTGKQAPNGWVEVGRDETTGKAVGWEPIEQSSFAKYHAEALGSPYGVVIDYPRDTPVTGGTYELVGPKVNGNPERVPDRHLLVRHGYTAAVDHQEMASMPLDFEGLAAWLSAHPDWEGIVWHHDDGRMAKLKRRDFPAAEKGLNPCCRCKRWQTYMGVYDQDGYTLRCYGCLRAIARCTCV